jgi:hypothetical protein
MPKPSKKINGRIPDSVLNQINEHTVGGYVLFYFNQETGEPEQVMNFDSPACYLALQKYMTDWTSAINEAMHTHKVEKLLSNFNPPPCDGEESKD